MGDLAPFVDAEDAVMDALGDIAPTAAWTGPSLQADLPLIQVRRIGGAGTGPFVDMARVSVSAYASTTAQAKRLATAAQQRLISRPAATPSGVIDRAETEVGPRYVPTSDPDSVRCYEAIYRVYGRRRH